MKTSKQILILAAGILLAAPFANADNTVPRCLNVEKLISPQDLSTVTYRTVNIEGLDKGSLLDQVNALFDLSGQVPLGNLAGFKQNGCDSLVTMEPDGKVYTQKIVSFTPTELVLQDLNGDGLTETVDAVPGQQHALETLEFTIATEMKCDTVLPPTHIKTTIALSWGKEAQKPDPIWKVISSVSDNAVNFILDHETCPSAPSQSDGASKPSQALDGGAVIQFGGSTESAGPKGPVSGSHSSYTISPDGKLVGGSSSWSKAGN